MRSFTSSGVAEKLVAAFVGHALRELRGDDVRATRIRFARHAGG